MKCVIREPENVLSSTFETTFLFQNPIDFVQEVVFEKTKMVLATNLRRKFVVHVIFEKKKVF